jgi:hypothetical protein
MPPKAGKRPSAGGGVLARRLRKEHQICRQFHQITCGSHIWLSLTSGCSLVKLWNWVVQKSNHQNMNNYVFWSSLRSSNIGDHSLCIDQFLEEKFQDQAETALLLGMSSTQNPNCRSLIFWFWGKGPCDRVLHVDWTELPCGPLGVQHSDKYSDQTSRNNSLLKDWFILILLR